LLHGKTPERHGEKSNAAHSGELVTSKFKEQKVEEGQGGLTEDEDADVTADVAKPAERRFPRCSALGVRRKTAPYFIHNTLYVYKLIS